MRRWRLVVFTDGITKACSLTACPSPTGGTGGGAGRGGTGGGTGGTAGATGSGGTGGAAGAPFWWYGRCGGRRWYGWCGGARRHRRCRWDELGGAPGGRGGASGTGGVAGSAGGTGGGVDGGTDARACETAECLRPYRCIRACGGPVVSNNCCACEAPLFDDYNGMACGDGGTAAISYVGCRFIGGIDRVVVAKRDTSRNLCVNVVFGLGQASTELTLPLGFFLESASTGPASPCPTRSVLATVGGPVTGTATWTSSGGVPSMADVDLVVTLPGNDEALIARGVNAMPGCP